MLEDLMKDPIAAAKDVLADLTKMLVDERRKRDEEMFPWYQRRAASERESERRACGERLDQIWRSYAQIEATLLRDILRIKNLLPPELPVIVITKEQAAAVERAEQVRG